MQSSIHFLKIKRLAIVTFAALTTSSPTWAQSLQISGNADQQGWAERMHTKTDGTLHFSVDGVAWQISGWPQALPQSLGRQHVEVKTMQHPAGPVRVLRLRKTADQQDWLELVSSGPTGRQVAPDWAVQTIDSSSVTLRAPDQTMHTVPSGKSLAFKSEARCERFGLIATHIPAVQAGLAQEAEARADWYVSHADCKTAAK